MPCKEEHSCTCHHYLPPVYVTDVCVDTTPTPVRSQHTYALLDHDVLAPVTYSILVCSLLSDNVLPHVRLQSTHLPLLMQSTQLPLLNHNVLTSCYMAVYHPCRIQEGQVSENGSLSVINVSYVIILSRPGSFPR